MTKGYYTTLPPVKWRMDLANVGFFPGYPLAGSLVQMFTGMRSVNALLIAAQLAAVAFWSYVLLIAGWARGRFCKALFTVFLVASFPTAFYLVAAYSESLFLASALGFFYWTQKEGRSAFVLAAAHGLVMTGTRIAGFPLALLPILATLLNLGSGFYKNISIASAITAFKRPLLLSLIAMSAGIGFFVFCHFKFGMWNLYMETQRIGWSIVPNYSAIFMRDSYDLCVPSGQSLGDCLSRSTVFIGMASLIVISVLISGLWFRGKIRPSILTLSLLGGAWGSFLISVTGLKSLNFISMIRYSLPVATFAILAVVTLVPPSTISKFSKINKGLWYLAIAVVIALALYLCSYENDLLYDYLQGRWVS